VDALTQETRAKMLKVMEDFADDPESRSVVGGAKKVN